MRPLRSSLLTSGIVAGFLIAGSAAFAQHGSISAGHGNFGGGAHGGFAGHAGGFAPHGFSSSGIGYPGRISTLAPHAITMPGRSVFPPSSRAFAPGFGSQPAWRNRGGWHDGGYRRDRGNWRGAYGYGGYPYYANSWELLPYDIGASDFMGDDTNGGAGQQSSAQPAESVPPPDTGFRPEYPGYEEQQSYAAPSAATAPIAPEPELTLIFKDGHTETIHNYVLTASDLVVLDQASAGRQQQIPLDELNLPATEKSAQQAGLDFTPPA